jgi:stage V sporulation protein R
MEGNEGWEMALEARAIDSDETFLRNYLDKHLVEELNLFAFGYNSGQRKQWEVTDTSWEKVRDALVALEG